MRRASSKAGPGLRSIEVVYARPQRQWVIEMQVPAGTSAREAAALADLASRCPELDPARCVLGVYGEVVADDYTLRDGDRLELYRPLQQDPREARRKAAARGDTLGGKAAPR